MQVTNVAISQMWSEAAQQDEEAKVFKIALHASIFPMTNHLIGWTAIVIPRYSGIITCGSNAALVIEQFSIVLKKPFRRCLDKFNVFYPVPITGPVKEYNYFETPPSRLMSLVCVCV